MSIQADRLNLSYIEQDTAKISIYVNNKPSGSEQGLFIEGSFLGEVVPLAGGPQSYTFITPKLAIGSSSLLVRAYVENSKQVEAYRRKIEEINASLPSASPEESVRLLDLRAKLQVQISRARTLVETKILTLIAIPNLAPVASFEASTVVGNAPLNVNFNGIASSDADGSISEYRWDISGIGTVGYGVNLSYLFVLPGTYTVTLTVKDNKGAEHFTTTEILVEAVLAPKFNAYFIAGSTYRFEAITSKASLTYEWDMGDGAILTGQIVEHTFPSIGLFNVTLTVIAANGEEVSTGKPVENEVLNPALINSDFLSGLLGWSTSGDASVVGRCPYDLLKCLNSNLAALITTADETTKIGELRQKFLVPSNAVKIIGKYRFLTDDLGSNDFFKISLNTVLADDGSVSTSSFGSGAGRFLHATSILDFEIPLTSLRNQDTMLKFEVSGSGPNDSALVITDLQLIQE